MGCNRPSRLPARRSQRRPIPPVPPGPSGRRRLPRSISGLAYLRPPMFYQGLCISGLRSCRVEAWGPAAPNPGEWLEREGALYEANLRPREP
jgi:hypothetical protein